MNAFRQQARSQAVASLQQAYDQRSDPRFEDCSDEAVDAVADEIEEELLTAGGSEDCDDERVQLAIDVEALRKARALCLQGARDAALVAFMGVFESAATAAAKEEAPDLYERRCRNAEEAAAEDRAEAMAEDRGGW